MDHRLNAVELERTSRTDEVARTDARLKVNSRNADALPNVDGLKLDHPLRVEHRCKLNELSVAVVESSDNSKRRHKANA